MVLYDVFPQLQLMNTVKEGRSDIHTSFKGLEKDYCVVELLLLCTGSGLVEPCPCQLTNNLLWLIS